MTTTFNANNLGLITNALSFEHLTEEEQEELLIDINAQIFRGSLIRLLERMNDGTREAFNMLIESDPTEELVEQFLITHVPDADKAVAETVEELTGDILAVTSN